MEKSMACCEMTRPHVAMYPAVGMGHLMPFLELAKKLVSLHGFAVTLITTTWSVTPLQAAYVEAALTINSHAIRQLVLPEICVGEDIANGSGQYFQAHIEKSMGVLEEKLRMLQEPNQPFCPVCALITDLFHMSSLDVTGRLGIPNYIFVTSSAAFLSFMFYMPQLARTLEGNENGNGDLIHYLPGVQRGLREADLPSLLHESSFFKWFLGLCSRLHELKGILLNTFHDLEPHTVNALLSGNVLESGHTPLIYVIGPVVRSSDVFDPKAVDSEEQVKRLTTWLDKQPDSSVVYVSFGSWGLLSEEQIREIATGLERSAQRFLWVLRGALPKSGPTSGRVSLSVMEVELNSILPEGFESRVQDRGLVIPSWAPQVGILSHPSVGGFVSHCGWNSTLEGIWHGVPIIAWPLYAEQRMNCVFIVNEWRIGLEVKMGPDGIVGQEEFQSVVKEVMEGEAGRMVRKNIKDLGAKARNALAHKEGSSFNSLEAALRDLVEASG
uniref:Glycosyltransferase n=1 Tax=Wollemia nobilis TaxID=56998 RepID=A0A0C9S621_9CONI